MSDTLWKAKAKRNHAEVRTGMEVEIVVRNRSGKPNIQEIKDALEEKYKIKAPGGLDGNIFEFIKC